MGHALGVPGNLEDPQADFLKCLGRPQRFGVNPTQNQQKRSLFAPWEFSGPNCS